MSHHEVGNRGRVLTEDLLGRFAIVLGKEPCALLLSSQLDALTSTTNAHSGRGNPSVRGLSIVLGLADLVRRCRGVVCRSLSGECRILS